MSLILSRDKVQNLDKESLIRFLSLSMEEGAQIDYKEKLSGENKNERFKEFLKDVTAFANAHGGLLLLGVKEPSDSYEAEDQIVGIAKGDDVAKDLERVAATSVDPRISGLLIKPVLVGNGNYVIVIHIPPSIIRPHMVSYRKHRTFYIRHSESSVPMTTHEIREAILSSATAEGSARNHALEEEKEALEYIIRDRPAFLLQAMPLVAIEEPWDVLNEPICEIIRGKGHKNYKYNQFDLASPIRPTPSIKGVIGRNDRENELWRTEVQRNGFIQAIYMDIDKRNDDPSLFLLHDGYKDLFQAFCDLCDILWKTTQTDVPYLFRNTYLNAATTVFLSQPAFSRYTDPYGRRIITWPEHIRQVGESLEKIYRHWSVQLFNAFGLNWEVPSKI